MASQNGLRRLIGRLSGSTAGTPSDGDEARSWASGVRTDYRAAAVLGLASIGIFGFGFTAWASLAPLASAVVAEGVVTASGENLQIQHLEGGIVRSLYVKEGEKVEAGQALLSLDPTAALAQSNRLRKQLVVLKAQAQRLEAERDGSDAIAFPDPLKADADESAMEKYLTEQRTEFDARLMRHRQEKMILEQRVTALTDQMTGMAAQQTAVESQLTEVRNEAARKKALLDKGLTNRSEYSQLVRSEADLIGQLGQAKATILSAQTQIAEAREQLARLSTQRVEAAIDELNDVRAKIADSEEQLSAAQDVLDRVVIRSPSDGVVVDMAVNSPGMVVRPGATILELLPTTDLMIEAHVSPRDADVVHIGQPARLRFTALNARTTPILSGKVTYLSADRLLNQDGQPYYVARLRLTGKLPRNLSEDQIYPGSPVETYIELGDRTFFEYLTKPLTDSFSRAFREE